MEHSARKGLSEVINELTEVFIDCSSDKVGRRSVEHWNTLLGVATYFGKRNALLVGNPGTGKTTYAAVISSLVSGLPFELFDTLKIQGHPDQTKDTMISRVDLGRLAEEGVIWQASLYLPSMVIDEINRLSPGKQSILLEYIRTNVAEHLGKTFIRNKTPFFATMNYNGTGTYPLSEPALDRFDISLELPPLSSVYNDSILEAEQKIEKRLKNPERTESLLTFLLQKDESPKTKLQMLQRESGKHKAASFSSDELARLSYTADGKTFMRSLFDELNMTRRYGVNRASDQRDMSDHNKEFASAKVIGGVSSRAWNALDYYARFLAYYLEDTHVDINHVQALAPYVFAHRLRFSDDYKALFTEVTRKHGEREEQNLARSLVSVVKKNYDDVSNAIKLLDSIYAGRQKMNSDAQKILRGPEPDHPLLFQYWKELKRNEGG